MTDRITELLAGREFLLADGAMGTNLFQLGLANGASGERWNVDEPDKIRDLHRSMVEAGADILLTNTFGANRFRLRLHGLESRVRELNEAAAGLAREVADAAGRPVVVAGSMGPTGDVLEPLGERTAAEAEDAFTDQAEALKAGGVDVAWIETIYAENELDAAMLGARRAGLPFIATMTFDSGGRTMMGIRPQDAVRLAPCRHHHPVGFGANCGVGPAQLLDSILGIAQAADASTIIIAKSNCGLPSLDAEMRVHYDGTPEIMATYAVMARDAGARVIGGCCGTGVAHLRAMREALEATPRGVVPTHADIEARLGPVKTTVAIERAVAMARDEPAPPRRPARRSGRRRR